MSTEITTPKTFEEKLKARVKDSIGDLISYADLTKLVERGIEEVFFKPRPNPARTLYSSSSTPETIPPLFYELLQQSLQPAVNAAIDKWVQENQDLVSAKVQEVVSNGVGMAILTAINNKLQEPLRQFQGEVYNTLNKR